MKKIIKFLQKIFSLNKDLSPLTIVGVGPGDPSLLTIASLKALKTADVIFYPISSEGKSSYSAEIVKKYIKNKKHIPLIFPMGREGLNDQEIWEKGARIIVDHIKKNYKVTLLCLGDISVFASSAYITNQIRKSYPEIKINNIPGISSFSLAAALGGIQLVEKGETLEILECPDDLANFSKIIKNKKKRVLVIMKVGKRWSWVKNILKKEDILDQTLLAVNIGMNNQFIGNARDKFSEDIPYFSLLLVRIGIEGKII